MFAPTPMRRKDRAMPYGEAAALLAKGEYGVLATVSIDGQPSATPLSYVVMNGAVYFHCAHTGLKMENLQANPAVCFTVVGTTQPVYDDDFTTLFESVMAYGTASLVTEEVEKNLALKALCEKYFPDLQDLDNRIEESIKRSGKAAAVARVDITQITGKAKRVKA